MATVTFYQAAAMHSPTVWYGDVVRATSSVISLSDGTYSGTYKGSFSYRSGALSGGNVTSYDNFINGARDYSVTGIKFSATRANAFLDSGDALGLQISVLAGNDNLNGSSFDDVLIGWAGNDVVKGNAGEDTLIGGTGADKLTGGAGMDAFCFGFTGSNELKTIDSITDFNRSQGDLIVLDVSLFDIALGTLDESAFVRGSRALDAEDRIIANGTKVFYDRDGSGSAKAVQIATVTIVGGGSLTASDFFGESV